MKSPEHFDIGGELRVHRLGFGAMRITGKGIWGPPRDRELAKRLLRRVVDLGINLIDTADSYGPNVSEELIAETLHPYPKGLVIATKGGLVRGGPSDWRRNGRPDHLRSACEGSLQRLKVECIDLYQLHAVDDAVPLEDSVGTLVDLQKEGKIRFIGISNVSVAQLHRAQKLTEIVTVQNRFNLGDRKHRDVLEECTRQGIGFIPWYPLASGNLAEAGGRLERIAADHRATEGQIALAWLLARSPIMLPIPGTSSLEHLEENWNARTIDLTEAEIETLSRA